MAKRPAILRTLRARETFWFYVFASPWILGFLIFYLGPMLASFGLSLTNYSVLLPTRFMGLSNYSAMFEDNLLGVSIWNTAYYAALAVPTSMAAGLGLAMVLNRGDLRGRSFLRSAFYVPAIMLPLSKPALTTVAIFQFQFTWNDFLGPLIYINSQDKKPLALGLQDFYKTQATVEWQQLMAASVMMVLPVVLLFFFLQRYFIEGIALTGLKG